MTVLFPRNEEVIKSNDGKIVFSKDFLQANSDYTRRRFFPCENKKTFLSCPFFSLDQKIF